MLPSFTAASGLLAAPRAFSCPPAGLCDKASRFCRTGTEQPWCTILDRCFDCAAPEPVCVPTVTCRPDPAGPAGCQICVRENCDGTGALWHTC
ncbi:hypothetical protein AB0F81_40330 [Actinoplanes sp. NPDC024001]|uniref:hypothetical protein n=1 Tax=Actinoplanes sp. NPDC024001 TaxID=3154598 RepID=UPI0033C63C08